MKAPERITIAMDEETFEIFKKMKDKFGISQSELMREALKFYSKHKTLFEFVEDKKVYTHAGMLSAGEHLILDIDHWLLFNRILIKRSSGTCIEKYARRMRSSSNTNFIVLNIY